jgi:hypothetical protein
VIQHAGRIEELARLHESSTETSLRHPDIYEPAAAAVAAKLADEDRGRQRLDDVELVIAAAQAGGELS